MRPEEGVETFRRILAPGSPRCIAVSTTNLQARIDQWINFKTNYAASANTTAELHERPELATEHVAPRSDAEHIIANIWEELLGIQHIGIHDNFFELGGQSLLATQIVARVRTVFKVELPLRKFFEGPSIAALAETVSAPRPDETSEKLAVVVPDVQSSPLVATAEVTPL